MKQPDIPARFRKNFPLVHYNRSTFYTFEDPVGYIDYTPYEEQTKL